MRHLWALVLLAGCAEPAVEAPGGSFLVDGKPIHPVCLYELQGWMSDARPSATAVDVEACAESNRYFGGVVQALRGGWEYRHPEHFGDGFFAYWPVGQTSTGVHVLHTVECGGGSGVFHGLLFVALERVVQRAGERLERRWILRRLGGDSLGDRTGDEASMDGDVVVIRSPDGRQRSISLKGAS